MTQKHKAPVGVISGTGVAEHFEVSDGKVVKTEYGAEAVYPAKDGSYYLLPRHGLKRGVPPHMMNYRANIYSRPSISL
jgi:5'-methylthioadenosine phosphorylase